MDVHTSFTKAGWDAFKADARPGPVQLLNLIRLRAAADYPDGRGATGWQAYEAYSRISEPVFRRIGGTIAWRGQFQQMLIGPSGIQWDICFVAQYPSVQAFAELMRDPVYREAMAHRQAGVEDCRLVRLAPLRAGEAFLPVADS